MDSRASARIVAVPRRHVVAPEDGGVTIMALTVETLDVLTALVILGGAAAVVMVAILVGQYLERRQARAAERVPGSSSRGIGPSEATDHPAPPAASSRGEELVASGVGALFVADVRGAGPAHPWRAAAAPDLAAAAVHGAGVPHEWTEPESDDLVARYRSGFLLDALAVERGIGRAAIVEELARRVFGAVDPVIDPLARRFGQPWTTAERRTLDSAAAAGHAVPELARQLGRDQLSVVFRLLHASAESRGDADGTPAAARETALLG